MTTVPPWHPQPQQPTRAFDGAAAADAVAARVHAEGWDVDDVRAAGLQASLLSYQSRTISAVERARSRWNQIWNPTGLRDVVCSPADYEHNAPWNDWTPPSESRRLFEAANLATAEAASRDASGVSTRVRVRVRPSADSGERGEKIAFASAEVDEQGAKALVLRRGCKMLAHLPMPMFTISVRQEPMHERILHVVTVSSFSGVSVCLYIENTRRLDAVLALIS